MQRSGSRRFAAASVATLAGFSATWTGKLNGARGLAAVGLYSFVSYTVLQRTGELGVHVALGARRQGVLRLVAFPAGTSVGLGVVAGLALSLSLNRLIARWIESGTRHPVLILVASGLLIWWLRVRA